MYSTLGSENNTTSYKRVLYGEITKNRVNCVYQLNIALYFNRRHSSIQSLWAKYVTPEVSKTSGDSTKRRVTTPLQYIPIVNDHLQDRFTMSSTTARNTVKYNLSNGSADMSTCFLSVNRNLQFKKKQVR